MKTLIVCLLALVAIVEVALRAAVVIAITATLVGLLFLDGKVEGLLRPASLDTIKAVMS